MSGNKSWSSEKDERLIELVKERRGLYDLQSHNYSDNIYKRKIWNEIEEAIELPGAKNRWEGLRAQYRKYLYKLKTKSGQAPLKICKWRYHDQMQFINKYINCDRPRISNIADDDVSNDNVHDTDIEDTDVPITMRTIKEIANEGGELEFNSVNTFASNVPPARKKQNKQKNIGPQEETASSTLMKYILENKIQERTTHPIDQFFSLISGTVKTFSAIDQHLIKTQVFTLVSQIEEKYITAASSPFLSPASVDHHQVSPAPTTYATSLSSSNTIPDQHIQHHSQTPLPQPTYYYDQNPGPSTSHANNKNLM